MKIEKKVIIIEFFIIILVFLLPGYLFQGAEVDPELFSSLRFNLIYIGTALPQSMLILYIIYIRRGKEERLGIIFSEYGFKPFETALIWKIVIVFAGTLFLAFAASFLTFIPQIAESQHFKTVRWNISDYRITPVVFLTCLTTGYREEILFRSYMMTDLQRIGLNKFVTVIFTSILFAAGHMYQGLLAFFTTFCIGLFLAFMFLRFKNVHMVAIGHGLYNFFSLILAPTIISSCI